MWLMAKTTLETKTQNLGEICIINGLMWEADFYLETLLM